MISAIKFALYTVYIYMYTTNKHHDTNRIQHIVCPPENMNNLPVFLEDPPPGDGRTMPNVTMADLHLH